MSGDIRERRFGRFRLVAWQILHFWKYGPEIRWFFWSIRLLLSLGGDRLAGRTPLLFSLTVWGHQQFIRPILEELRRRNRKYSFYLILDQQTDLPEGKLLGVARWKVRPYREYLPFGKRFAALLSPDIAARHPPSDCPLRIYTGHGLPSKLFHWSPTGAVTKFTHWCLQGPLFRELQQDLAARAPQVVARVGWLETGYPKSDELLARKGERDVLLEKFGLDPKLPTVLFAPAFDRGTSLERYGEAIFRTLMELEGMNVLVKLHPVSYDRSVIGVHSKGIYWPDVLKKYEGARFRHVGNVEVTECLLAADVMVCDVSGVALEYLLLDRPVVYLACPDFFRGIGAPPDGGESLLVNAGRPAGVEVGDMAGLARAVREALGHPEHLSYRRHAVIQKLLFNPGHATRVTVDTLERLLSTPAEAGK